MISTTTGLDKQQQKQNKTFIKGKPAVYFRSL